MANIPSHNIVEAFSQLVQVMEVLRSSEGCSWDREQTNESLKKFVLEEAQEVCEAVEKGDVLHLCEELGDLAMIIVFFAQIAKEAGTFTINEVMDGIVQKLIFRHPHVFGKREGLSNDGVLAKWKLIKVVEKKEKRKISSRMGEMLKFFSPFKSALGVQEEAAKVGFDFPDLKPALEKIREELQEFSEVYEKKGVEEKTSEIGDLLFSVVNVCRLSGINPEDALRQSARKFVDRFSLVEKYFEKKGGMAGKKIEELDSVWEKVKKGTRKRN